MKRIAVTILIALSFIWLGSCQRCSAQQIIGRPMLPLQSGVNTNATSLTNGLLVYYRLDESSGNRSAAFGGPTPLTDNNTVTSTTGVQTNAAFFTAANTEFLSAGALPPGGQSFTIAHWFKITAFPASEFYMQNMFANPGGHVTGTTIYNADKKLRFWIHNGGIPGTFQWVTNSTVLATNTLYYAVCTYDSTNTLLKASINGGAYDTSTGNLSIAGGSSEAFYIGNFTQASLPFDGWIDEWGMWTRPWSAEELSYMYNAGAGRAFTPGAAAPFH